MKAAYLFPLAILLIAAALVGTGFWAFHMEQTSVHRAHRERVEALVCWHEFQSGRRATTADCPPL